MWVNRGSFCIFNLLLAVCVRPLLLHTMLDSNLVFTRPDNYSSKFRVALVSIYAIILKKYRCFAAVDDYTLQQILFSSFLQNLGNLSNLSGCLVVNYFNCNFCWYFLAQYSRLHWSFILTNLLLTKLLYTVFSSKITQHLQFTCSVQHTLN